MRSSAQPNIRPSVPPPSTGRPTHADGWLALGVLAALLGVIHMWDLAEKSSAVDFHLVWIATDAIRHRVVLDLYREQDDAAVMDRYVRIPAADKTQKKRQSAAAATSKLGLTGTPVLYATLAPLTAGNYERDCRVYQAVSQAALFVAILLFGRSVGLSTAASLLIFGLLALGFGPIASDVRTGNVNRIQLAMLAVAAALLAPDRSRGWLALGGFVLAWAVLFKPNLIGGAAAVAVWWAAGRRVQPLLVAGAGAAAAAIVGLVVTTAYFGSARCWLSWYDAAHRLREWYRAEASSGNLGLMEALRDATGRDLSIALMVAFGLAVAATAWLSRIPVRSRDGSRGSPSASERVLLVAMLGAGSAVWLESAWLAWLHYYVMLTPLVLLALRPLGAVRPGVRWAARGAGVFAVVAFGPETPRLLPGLTYQSWAALLNTAAGLLLAFVLFDAVRVARAERAAEVGGRRSAA